MVKTNIGLVDHARAFLGAPYWWGTFGQVATTSLLIAKQKQYPEQFSGNRVAIAKAKHIGKRVVDCCGLIKSYIFMDTPTSSPKYSAIYDKNVGGIIAACPKHGAIATLPDVPGTLIFQGTHHVGIYIGGGKVIEAKGFDYGVVMTALTAAPWDSWGQLTWIDYIAVPAPLPAVNPNVVKLTKERAYSTATSLFSFGRKSGTYYFWDDAPVNGRRRMTNSPDKIGKPGQVSFWIKRG